MTPLEFFISVQNSEAKNGLMEVQQKVDRFKESTNELYEGPAREMKIRTEIRGMIKDIAEGESPVYAMVNIFERLSEVVKFAGPLAAILALTTGIGDAEYNAYKGSLDFLDSYKKAMSGDVKNMTLDQLRETRKALDDTDEKFKKLTWVQWLMNGGVFRSAKPAMAARSADIDKQTDDETAAQIQAQTTRMEYEASGRTNVEGEIAEVRKKYQALQNDAEAKGLYEAANAYGTQMIVQIQEIKDKAQKADDELADKKKARMLELTAELARAEDESKSLNSEDLVAAYNDLDHQIQNAYDPEAKLQLEIKAARMRKEIGEDEKRASEQSAQAEEKAAADAATAEEKSATLRQEVLKAQFDALDKEDKVVVLRGVVARLDREVQQSTGDVQAKKEKALLDAGRQLSELTKRDSILHGLDADTALRGAMSSGQYGRVTNDSANRAEKQRDQMVGLLTKIANQKLDLSQLDAF